MNKYSVVHNGPIKYFPRLLPALNFARRVLSRKGFRLMGRWWKLKPTDTITVHNMDTGNNVQVFECKDFGIK